MQRLWNLNWENITYDHDISGLMRGLIDWGVIEGGTVVGNKLQPVQAIVPLVRSNGQKILAFFESDEVIDLPTTGDYKVYIEVDQSKIDFGGNNPEDGTGIASIKTWPTLPSQNFLLLASVTSWVAKDERNLIPKVSELAQRATTLEEKVSQTEKKVGKLEEAGIPDHLAEKIIVGEKYFLGDPLILMDASQKEQLNTTLILGKDHMCKELHIQRISSWVASNKVNLCVIKAGTPLDLIVEIRKGQRVDISEDEAYWIWGDELLASGKVSHTVLDTVNNSYNEIEVELDKSFVLPEGELISVVLYQQGKTMNPNNYYIVRCLGDRHSEAFRGISIQDWGGKGTNRWTPYATSPAFLSKVLVKQYITDKLDVSGQPGSISIPGRYVANDSQSWTDYSFITLPWNKGIFSEMMIFGALQVELDYDLNFAGNWSNQQVSFWIYGNFVGMDSSRYSNVTNWKNIFNRMLWSDWMDKGRRVVEKWRLVRRIDLWQPSTIQQLGLAVARQNIGNSPKLNYTLKNTLIITAQQFPNYTWKKFYPREVKDIGQKASCTTFGRHVDGGWVA